MLLVAGCDSFHRTGPAVGRNGVADEARAAASSAFGATDVVLPLAAARPIPARLDVLIRVLHVQIPRDQRAAAAGVWATLREASFDSQTLWRLNRNGWRVALGRTERWDEIEAALAAVPGGRRHEYPPLRTPAGVPLTLRIDAQPKEYTVFYIGTDGILSGETWTASERVLRLTYGLDIARGGRIIIEVVPELWRSGGIDLTHTEAGLVIGPRRDGRAFGVAALSVSLGTNDFLLIGPGRRADVYGLLGGTFLQDTIDERSFDSYLFIRADVSYVNRPREG